MIVISYEEWKKEQLRNPAVSKEYEALKPEYKRISKQIKEKINANKAVDILENPMG